MNLEENIKQEAGKLAIDLAAAIFRNIFNHLHNESLYYCQDEATGKQAGTLLVEARVAVEQALTKRFERKLRESIVQHALISISPVKGGSR
jgi:hypothetical protein